MFKKALCFSVLLLCAASPVRSFVLLGPGDAEGNPAKAWQARGANNGWSIGYDFPGDIGAPVFRDEFYRWNVPYITYAFDPSFVDFFGPDGIRAIEEIFELLNDLPSADKMSPDLREFPLSTLRRNEVARQFGLVDIKSAVMPLIFEELGLAQADRWVWSLHHREPLPGPGGFGEYDVINGHNIDPFTGQPSRYVNETLYSYQILEVPPPGAQTPYSDAVEIIVPENTIPNFPVTSFAAFTPGNFFSGFTRDDVGGLRYLWHPKTRAPETLLPGVTAARGGIWSPYIGTNFLGTNTVGTGTNVATAAARGGVNKVRFRRVSFDAGGFGGTFTPRTNTYSDQFVLANGKTRKQTVSRPIVLPDFIFTAVDLNQNSMVRTTTAGWINNDTLSPTSLQGGPGIIVPSVTIGFNKLFPVFVNQTPDFVDGPQPNGAFGGVSQGFIWASFDGTANDPIIFPTSFNFVRDILNSARQQGGF